MVGDWRVRQQRADEWAELRRLRLEALQDTPMAYQELYRDAAANTDEEWQQRAAANATAPDRCMFIAEDADGRWLGMMGAYTNERRGPVLIAVYVTPRARGRGVSDALVEAVEGWARQRSDHLVLWVHEDNPPARKLYERLGYTYTGEREPYDHEPGGYELVMSKPL